MLRLLTIPFSHFSEKARWALDRAVASGASAFADGYQEHPHLPVFSRLATLPHKSSQVPVLVTDKGAIADSTQILLWVDQQLPEACRLYPDDPALRQRVLDLEERYDRKLGRAVRTVMYSHLFATPKAIEPLFSSPKLPKVQRMAVKTALGRKSLMAAMKSALALTPERTERELTSLRALLSEAEALLKTQPYLCGERFSAADLTFAALLSPLLQAPQCPSTPLPDRELSLPLRHLLETVRQSKAGQHALRLYADYR